MRHLPKTNRVAPESTKSGKVGKPTDQVALVEPGLILAHLGVFSHRVSAPTVTNPQAFNSLLHTLHIIIAFQRVNFKLYRARTIKKLFDMLQAKTQVITGNER